MQQISNYVGDFNINEVKELIKSQKQAGKLMAELVVSAYFGKKKMNMRQLDVLDQNAFRMAVAIIGHRRTDHWDDKSFFELANFAASQHNIKI